MKQKRRFQKGTLLLALALAMLLPMGAAAHAADGTATQGQSVLPGEEITLPDDTASASLTATWGVRVVFQDHDGTELANDLVAVSDDAPGTSFAPQDPAREGYAFTGWERADGNGGVATLGGDGSVTGIAGPGPIVFKATYEQKAAPADKVPRTGDGAGVAPWLALMLVSLAGLAGAGVHRTRRCRMGSQGE